MKLEVAQTRPGPSKELAYKLNKIPNKYKANPGPAPKSTSQTIPNEPPENANRFAGVSHDTLTPIPHFLRPPPLPLQLRYPPNK